MAKDETSEIRLRTRDLQEIRLRTRDIHALHEQLDSVTGPLVLAALSDLVSKWLRGFRDPGVRARMWARFKEIVERDGLAGNEGAQEGAK